MDYEKLQKYLGTEDMSVVEAMQKIDMNSKGIIYIADESGKLLGSLTDGDIRRWLIKTADLNGRASDMMFRNVRFLFKDDYKKAKEFTRRWAINSIPIVDSDYRILDLVIEEEIPEETTQKDHALKGIPVIVMAGEKEHVCIPIPRYFQSHLYQLEIFRFWSGFFRLFMNMVQTNFISLLIIEKK